MRLSFARAMTTATIDVWCLLDRCALGAAILAVGWHPTGARRMRTFLRIFVCHRESSCVCKECSLFRSQGHYSRPATLPRHGRIPSAKTVECVSASIQGGFHSPSRRTNQKRRNSVAVLRHFMTLRHSRTDTLPVARPRDASAKSTGCKQASTACRAVADAVRLHWPLGRRHPSVPRCQRQTQFRLPLS